MQTCILKHRYTTIFLPKMPTWAIQLVLINPFSSDLEAGEGLLLLKATVRNPAEQSPQAG